MEPAQAALLQDVLRRESRSLLQYVSESYPWTKPEGHAACAAVNAIAQTEAAAVARLGRWLAKQRVPVGFPGAYPTHFTTTNFVALRYLLPRLADDQRQRIAGVEKVRASLLAGEAREQLDLLLAVMKDHLKQLEALQTNPAPPAIAS
jgi:hypothetical protein